MWECETIFLRWWLTQYKQIEKKNDVSEKTDTVLTQQSVLTSIQFFCQCFWLPQELHIKPSVWSFKVHHRIDIKLTSNSHRRIESRRISQLCLYFVLFSTKRIFLHLQTLRRGGGRAVLFRGRHPVREGRGSARFQGGQPRGPPDLLWPRRQGQAGKQEAGGVLWVLKWVENRTS